MSKLNKEECGTELPDQPKIIEALKKTASSSEGTYHMVLLDGAELDLPVHKCSHAIALQAQRGEKFIDTSEDEIDPDRNIRIWVKKVNAGVGGGWQFVNDLMKAPNPPKGDLDNKKIPVSQVTTLDWATLEAILYPGSELDRKSIRERASATFGAK
jgi:hypothetical protein